ncbi:MAG TPA: rhodanese-like domain-containing protein [Candidatus Binatia bacterium]|nr:rhodanese-like domain-containing protein [Candidatus Binatia bacterium]
MQYVTATELSGLMGSNSLYAVFDIRERGEYNARQISFATSLPRSQIEFRIADLVPNRAIPLVVYDEGGDRAGLAALTLTDLGYTAVSVLTGGLPAWQRQGLPVTSGVNVPSKAFGEKVQRGEAIPEISSEELKQLIDANSDIVIFDVRTPEEYARFCIPGGLNVPGGDLVLWAHHLKQTPHTKFIVNCAGRTRSIIGTAVLRRLGLTNVFELRNGTMGWVLAGFDLEANPNRRTAVAPEESRATANDLALKIADDEKIARISCEELAKPAKTRADEVRYILDVRSADEYDRDHIAGSLSVPGGQAVQRADDFIAVRNGKIVFVSNRSARAIMAAYWYVKMGFRDVAVLNGGITSWLESGRRLARGAERAEPLGYEKALSTAKLLKPAQSQALAHDPSVAILDVGESNAYKAAHLAGAHWISRGWLEPKLPEFVPDKSASILMTCPDGQNSVLAARTLRELGYADVTVLEGGVNAWRTAGYPTETGMTSCWSEANDVVLSPSITGDKQAMQQYLDWEVRLKH